MPTYQKIIGFDNQGILSGNYAQRAFRGELVG
jgi:hypothetical protein